VRYTRSLEDFVASPKDPGSKGARSLGEDWNMKPTSLAVTHDEITTSGPFPRNEYPQTLPLSSKERKGPSRSGRNEYHLKMVRLRLRNETEEGYSLRVRLQNLQKERTCVPFHKLTQNTTLLEGKMKYGSIFMRERKPKLFNMYQIKVFNKNIFYQKKLKKSNYIIKYKTNQLFFKNLLIKNFYLNNIQTSLSLDLEKCFYSKYKFLRDYRKNKIELFFNIYSNFFYFLKFKTRNNLFSIEFIGKIKENLNFNNLVFYKKFDFNSFNTKIFYNFKIKSIIYQKNEIIIQPKILFLLTSRPLPLEPEKCSACLTKGEVPKGPVRSFKKEQKGHSFYKERVPSVRRALRFSGSLGPLGTSPMPFSFLTKGVRGETTKSSKERVQRFCSFSLLVRNKTCVPLKRHGTDPGGNRQIFALRFSGYRNEKGMRSALRRNALCFSKDFTLIYQIEKKKYIKKKKMHPFNFGSSVSINKGTEVKTPQIEFSNHNMTERHLLGKKNKDLYEEEMGYKLTSPAQFFWFRDKILRAFKLDLPVLDGTPIGTLTFFQNVKILGQSLHSISFLEGLVPSKRNAMPFLCLTRRRFKIFSKNSFTGDTYSTINYISKYFLFTYFLQRNE
jgi:hypothetical protein